MATIKSIEKEIAELEKQQRAAKSKLNQLRNAKRKMIEQSEIDCLLRCRHRNFSLY